jgi:hypothetical protein
MKHIIIKPYSAHQELSQLLPWYVNNTLQDSELKAVENHLTVCLTCKRELVQLQKLAQAVIQEGSLDSAEQAAFSRLKKRLHTGGLQTGQQLGLHALSQQDQPAKHTIGASDNIRPLSGARKRVWANSRVPRPALALAAAVLLSLLVPRYIETDLKQQGNDFRTLSNAQQETLSANEIRVVFAENVGQQQKNKILDHVHGQLIDNPTAQGVYTVRLEKDISSTHLLNIVETLRKDANVIFAEPAYALLSSTHTEE